MIKLSDTTDQTPVVILDKVAIEKAITVIQTLTDTVANELQKLYPGVGFEVSVDRHGRLTLWSNRATPANSAARWKVEELFTDLEELVNFVNDVRLGKDFLS